MIIAITSVALAFFCGFRCGAAAIKPPPPQPLDVEEKLMRDFERFMAFSDNSGDGRPSDAIH